MNIVEDRRQQAAENILGNEKLTADLDDAAANVLLDWGLNWATATVLQTAAMDNEQAQIYLSPRLKALRRMLRQVNLWIRDLETSSPEEQAERLAKTCHQAYLARGYPAEMVDPATFLNQALHLHGEASKRIAGVWLLLDEEQE